MSVLTKVFVLLLSVFSIALSMLVIGAFERQENWRQSAADWQAVAVSAQSKYASMASAAAIAAQRDLDQHQRDAKEIQRLAGEAAAKDAKISELTQALADAGNKVATEQAQVTSLARSLEVVQGAFNSEQELGRKLAARNAQLERLNVDLNDRVKELTVNISMAAAQVHALQQQITAMEETQSAAATGLAPARQVPGGPGIVEAHMPTVRPAAAPSMIAPIRGQITSFRDGIASISVGSADGVVAGMTFLIYRRGVTAGNAQYLGTLKIDRVNAGESGGTVDQAEGDIRAGDLVRDEASFAMRK